MLPTLAISLMAKEAKPRGGSTSSQWTGDGRRNLELDAAVQRRRPTDVPAMTCLAATRVNRRAVRSGSWCPGGTMDGGISARATSATLPPDGPSRKKLPLVARAPWGIAGWTTTKRRGERRQEMENVSPSIENPSLGVGSNQVSGQNPVVVDTRPAVMGFAWEGNPGHICLGLSRSEGGWL